MTDVEQDREGWAQEAPVAPPKEIEVRNPRHTDGGIDCHIQHDVYGWIPFCARAGDGEAFGRELYADLVAGKYGVVAPPRELTEEQKRELRKIERERLMSEIVVTTLAGNRFDGDELSQGRMARTILTLQAKPVGEKTEWISADNRSVLVDAAELIEALTLAGARQTEIWLQE